MKESVLPVDNNVFPVDLLPSLDPSAVSSINTSPTPTRWPWLVTLLPRATKDDSVDASSASCSIRKTFPGQLIQLKNLVDAGFNGELGRPVSYRKHKNRWGVLLVGYNSKDNNSDLDMIIYLQPNNLHSLPKNLQLSTDAENFIANTVSGDNDNILEPPQGLQ